MNIHLQLDRNSEHSLQDQLFEQLRQMILTGILKPNSRLIATRFLAEQIGVSRTTVLLVYERLISEGYLETRPAVGTFVSPTPPADTPPADSKLASPHASNLDVPRQASLRPAMLHGMADTHVKTPDGYIDFSPLQYELSQLLPPKTWLRGIRSVLEGGEKAITAPPLAGVRPLRQAICDHLVATRGLAVSPDQVVIVSGRQQACSFIAHLFQHRGDRVVLESPCDGHLTTFFGFRDAEIVPVPVDGEGLETDRLPDGEVSLAYVSPARQNPTGGTMPVARRKALIEWARAAGSYVVEDDTDGDLLYFGAPPPPLMALDPYGLAFFMGSFAKSLGSGMAFAYLVSPPEFVEAILALKVFADGGRQWLEQMVVADLLNSGQYDHHLRRLRKQNLERRDCLIDALRSHFGDVRLMGTEIGSQLTWILPEEFPDARVLCGVARAHGVILKHAASARGMHPESAERFDRAVLIGYGHLPIDQIRTGIARLADAITL